MQNELGPVTKNEWGPATKDQSNPATMDHSMYQRLQKSRYFGAALDIQTSNRLNKFGEHKLPLS